VLSVCDDLLVRAGNEPVEKVAGAVAEDGAQKLLRGDRRAAGAMHLHQRAHAGHRPLGFDQAAGRRFQQRERAYGRVLAAGQRQGDETTVGVPHDVRAVEPDMA